jgi:hypothetical protein
MFLFAAASIPALEPPQFPIQWVAGAVSPGVKRPGREADHSPPSNAEVNNAWRYTSILKYVFMEWCLVKYRDDIECDTGSLPRIKKGVVLNEAQYFMTYGTGITNSGFHRLHTHDNYRAPCGLLVTEDQTMEPIRTHSVYELWAAKTPL